MTDWSTVWAAVAAIAASVSAVVLIAAASVAYYQLGEARRLREAQVRPFISLDFDAQRHAPLIYLIISNLGSTMARDVRFQFDPALRSSWDKDGEPRFAELNIFKEGIPSFVPGKSIELLFDVSWGRKDLPNRYDADIRYRGERDREYQDSIVLDLDMYWDISRIDRRDIHDVHERLKELVAELKKWTAMGRGLLTLSPGEYEERWKEWAAQRQERLSKEASAENRADHEGAEPDS